jgi:two-component system, chemotaxis family, CheB/CheR fusion protein
VSESQVLRDDSSFEALLAYLRRTRGFDFGNYKRASLERRLRKRMGEVGVPEYTDYIDYLEVHQDEFQMLFDTVLINVTAFFRDPAAWEYLAAEIVPRLRESADDEAPVRVWSAGCASGEESYTLAMVLAEAFGEDAYMQRVKIYATEIDDEALANARHGVYTGKQVEPIPGHLVDRYFERVDRRYAFRKDMRRTMIFGRNDLTRDAPISRIDLLACRNTLMYFNAETQSEILGRLHFALNPSGYLFLGKSEMLITHTDLFRPVDLKRRVFSKVARPARRGAPRSFVPRHPEPPQPPANEIRDGTFESGPSAQVVVDTDGVVVLANARARRAFGLAPSDIGRPLRDLELSYRPVDLRTNLDLAYSEARAIAIDPVTVAAPGGEPRDIAVQITPLRSEEQVIGASIMFVDVTAQRGLESELDAARRELENAYEELQSTVEELETTNEELQSTNEELETTNEELQSANEELETMNEELQSTNEELETINDELRQRSGELNEINAFLETILTTMGLAVIVVDPAQKVQVWNAESTDLWGLRADETEGRSIGAIDLGMPAGELEAALRGILDGTDERAQLEADATNRRGRAVRLRITCLPLAATRGRVTGAIVMMETVASQAAG